MSDEYEIPKPASGDSIFKIDDKMFVRFNREGWVEEVGNGKKENDGSTALEGMPGTKLDDLYADRYYDLYSRIVLVEIHAGKQSNEKSAAYGSVLFKDLEKGSPLYDRVNRCILISNHYFETDLRPLD